MPRRFQLNAQLMKIVDFAVVQHGYGTRLVPHRLAAAGNVDDAQPPHAHNSSARHEHAFIVRPAMNQRSEHPSHRGFIGR